MDSGNLGALIGGLAGVIGGLTGSYLCIRNARRPKERAFMVKAVALCWILVVSFVALEILLPGPYGGWLWAPYLIGLLLAVRHWSKRWKEIREEER